MALVNPEIGHDEDGYPVTIEGYRNPIDAAGFIGSLIVSEAADELQANRLLHQLAHDLNPPTATEQGLQSIIGSDPQSFK